MNEIDKCLLKAFEYVIKKDNDLFDAHEISYAHRPDIIIHKRKFKDNLAVIELKKDEITKNDKNKIEGLCQAREYEYANGYCISINKRNIIKYAKKNKKWINILGDCYE